MRCFKRLISPGTPSLEAFYTHVISAPSLHRASTDALILRHYCRSMCGCMALDIFLCMGQYWLRCGESIKSFTALMLTNQYVYQQNIYEMQHFLIQIMKTWQLLCIIAGITGVGVVLIVVKTIVQAVTHPQLVRNSENPYGTTVQKSLHNPTESIIIYVHVQFDSQASRVYNYFTHRNQTLLRSTVCGNATSLALFHSFLISSSLSTSDSCNLWELFLPSRHAKSRSMS